MPVGEGGRECGNKDRGKGKEMESGSFAQPSITFLGFKFIWLHFSSKYTEHRRGSEAGGWREKMGEAGEGRGDREEYMVGGNYLGVRE